MHTEPTRLTVFCGFLGSGKTTFLRHQLQTGALKPGALIINEAATVPVDPELLPGLAVAVLSGGCACCTAREHLIALLRELLAATTPPRPISCWRPAALPIRARLSPRSRRCRNLPGG